MPILTPKIQKTREKLAEAEANSARWQAQLDEHRTTLAELEATMGADALAAVDDAAVESIRERLLKVRTSIDVATAAVGSAEGAVVDARRAVLTAASSVVADRARGVRSDADRHAERTAKLLAELTEHEGFEYRPVMHSEVRGWTMVRTRAELLQDQADTLDKLAAEILKAASEPNVDAERVRRLVAKADPEGPEAEHVDAERTLEQERADAWRTYAATVEAARRAWLDDRTAQLLADEKRGLSEVQATDLAAAEYRTQVRQHPSQQDNGPEAKPFDIDAWALEQLGAPVDRPAVLVGA